MSVDYADLERLLAELCREFEHAAVNAPTPEGYPWGRDPLKGIALDEFEAGKRAAARAVIAAAKKHLPSLLEERRQTRALAENEQTAIRILAAASFERDRDLIRCRHCGRAIHQSRAGEAMHHQAECPLAGLEALGFNPWGALADARSAGLIETAKEGSNG